jgi:hypothetical protein
VTRFLICIDEFERLPDLFPASADGTAQRDLLQLLDPYPGCPGG